MEDDQDDGMAKPAAAAPRRMKAPPKTAPPSAADTKDDAKTDGAGEVKKKKKALPPPSKPPPQGANAAAAFRAKSSLPPPNGPPPGSAASASVAKVRGAARPPSGAPPGAKPKGPPPSTPPPNDSKASAPAARMAPPKSTAKDESTAPPSEAKATKQQQQEVKEAKKPTENDRSNETPRGEKKATKAPPASLSRRPSTQTTPRSSAPVDILGDESPIHATKESVKTTDNSDNLPTRSSHWNEPSSDNDFKRHNEASSRPSTSVVSTAYKQDSRPSTSVYGGGQPKATPTPTVRRTTMEVLHDTSSSLSRYSRNLDESTAPIVDNREDNAPVAASATGRAVPFSGLSRPNVPEDEIITVKKPAPKREIDSVTKKSPTEAKEFGKGNMRNVREDSIDDVEEIPFLEEEKLPSNSKKSASVPPARDDDPEIVFEVKNPPRPGSRTSSFVAENKSTEPTSSRSRGDEKDEEMLLVKGSKDTDEDIYDELRKMKRSPTPQEENNERTMSHSSSSSSTKREPADEEGRDSRDTTRDSSTSTSRSREKRREKRRTKRDEEPKRIQAQFYNPKSVPYIPDHLLDFVKRPLECGRGHIVKCFIERNESGQNKLAPLYTLLLEVNSSSGRPIMYARKKATSRITSHYVISLNKEDLFLPRMMRSHQYVGKLRSSTSMMEYCLYDQGDNPEDLDSDCEIDDEMRKNIRAELAVIRYHNTKKQYARKMEVLIPTITESGTSYLDWRPISRDQMMEEHARAIVAAGGQNVLDASNFIFMHKRETKYDPLSSCIVDFRSRATCVSVKNFQLVHSEPMNEQMKEKYRQLHPEYVYDDQGTVSLPQEFVLLQLGKVGKDCFNMDFQYPLSMLQAFAISLSRFDTKQR